MNILKNNRKKLTFITVALLVFTMVLTACQPAGDSITVGAKNFTESRILATMFQVLIQESTDLNVNVTEFGGTQLVFGALQTGDVDLYPEYTGTAYTVMLEKEAISDPDETYDIVKTEFKEGYNLIWLDQLGFNNTYTLTVREQMAEELGLETFSDLLDHDEDLVLGATFEFLERPDGYPGLQEAYGFNFADERGFDPGLTYSSVRNGEVDVIDGFSTDGRIPAFNLVALEDDQNFFPPYYAAPVVNAETLERYPELEEILSRLAGQISDEEMQEMNFQIDEIGQTEEQVAREFLESKGLL
ncbi:MAG: glycine/betaine ABC transporter substrate-binding protein [Clostridiaceae bacterium]|nr:glycine/betaine ABC transporter substrate-binding protein [Clostridiaceae bacterium]